jgi:hypothetical protein
MIIEEASHAVHRSFFPVPGTAGPAPGLTTWHDLTLATKGTPGLFWNDISSERTVV